jgi:hypothetical protein
MELTPQLNRWSSNSKLTNAPTAKLDTIMLVLSLSAQFGWRVHNMDVESAFLNEDLVEEMHTEQPERFVAQVKDRYV